MVRTPVVHCYPMLPCHVLPFPSMFRADKLTAKSAQYQYLMKVVPTVFEPVSGRSIASNQFSVTEFVKHSDFHTFELYQPGMVASAVPL